MRSVWMAVAVVVGVVVGGLMAGCGSGGNGAGTQANAGGKVVVVSTIFPYFDAVRAIGGDKVDARILVPPMASPHEYEPSMQNKLDVSNAKLVVKNGLGLDDQFDKLYAGTGAKVLDISKALPAGTVLDLKEVSLGDTAAEKAQENAEANVQNPHIWLDPHVQMAAAEQIKESLEQIDPADKATFETNAAKYQDSLKQLDDDYKAAVPTFKTKEFIGFHSAYEYLARRYGLKQVASIEEVPEAGLNLAQAQKIINLIKADHIKYVALEPGLNPRSVDLITRETGVGTIVLQPIEEYNSINDTYVGLMRENLEALKKVLGGS
ncbi:MAG TPA: zinc ABC transporter substrate-binding protein [Phycisphaerae bacterium]|nr:zinc ABC transporter substrate-binding protein [Phycisphaerae bacterium]